KPGLPDGNEPRTLEDNRDVVEFHILDETAADEDSAGDRDDESDDIENLSLVTARQRQAAVIARRIRKMVGADGQEAEFQIHDKPLARLRDVEYRDIVVLMRSPAQKANDYVEIFRLAGVPVSCQATAGYFEVTEITDMAALLKVLDNPQRDIELAAVLRSPFFKVSDTELKSATRSLQKSESAARRTRHVALFMTACFDTATTAPMRNWSVSSERCWRGWSNGGRRPGAAA
ncbi:MAG: 3'-5' exonuclease, partial [Planctomycetota bacterium]